MPDDGRRYELIGGAIVMTPAPGPKHQLISARLQRLLEDALSEGHAVSAAPIGLDLPGEQRVQPDPVVLPWSSVGEKRLTVPVLLVVEIVSGGSRTPSPNEPSTPPLASAPTGSSTPKPTS